MLDFGYLNSKVEVHVLVYRKDGKTQGTI